MRSNCPKERNQAPGPVESCCEGGARPKKKARNLSTRPGLGAGFAFDLGSSVSFPSGLGSGSARGTRSCSGRSSVLFCRLGFRFVLFLFWLCFLNFLRILCSRFHRFRLCRPCRLSRLYRLSRLCRFLFMVSPCPRNRGSSGHHRSCIGRRSRNRLLWLSLLLEETWFTANTTWYTSTKLNTYPEPCTWRH